MTWRGATTKAPARGLAVLVAFVATLVSAPLARAGLETEHAEGPSLAEFFELWDLFGDAALTGAFAGAALGMLGVYVVLRRMVFLSAAVSQASSFGVVLAFFLQVQLGLSGALGNPALWATIACALALWLLWADRAREGSDARLGIVYIAGLAGTLVLATKVTQELHDAQTLLFGTAVAVTPEEFALIATLSVGLLVIHAWLHRGFLLSSFDPQGAATRGLPVRALDAGLLVTLALAIALMTRTLGALTVFALSVLPALAALKIVANARTALVVASLIGAGSAFFGYLAAYMWDLPVGASQALMALLVLLVASIVASLGRPAPQAMVDGPARPAHAAAAHSPTATPNEPEAHHGAH